MNLEAAHRRFNLESIVLHEASIQRGAGAAERPGEVENSGELQAAQLIGKRAAYLVGLTTVLKDEDGETIMQIDVSFAATYSVEEGFEPDEATVEWFAWNGVVYQVHPYIREFISSATTRAGLPPAFLPVLVRDELDAEWED